ncbi:PIN domain-containing protein [Actinomycetospora endophytica]|uniref:PIN domain-containing protein n=1 Tax=Actinomycetospora endophytica TaxID=2291215 RepID=A0ABS8PDZ7_9PSEU|nr:PIN domain-containing protein [Actinomycetospora endophytica]MCD2195695.1 PIN domain-containing protein [Actinomycetospora endophytica]
MLRLLIDTCIWLDIAKNREGRKVIHPLASLVLNDMIDLIVPGVVREEFQRNRPRAEDAVSKQVQDRVRAIRQDIREHGGVAAGDWIDELNHQVPFLSASAVQNFAEIDDLLSKGRPVEFSEDVRKQVIHRGLAKQAPFLEKNSTADALLIECFGEVTRREGGAQDEFLFVTSNSRDFSARGGDQRVPHPDIAEFFKEPNAHYIYGAETLATTLRELIPEYEELEAEAEAFDEEPRTLADIVAAENERFDKIWYVRSLIGIEKEERGEESPPPPDIVTGRDTNMRRVIAKYGAENVGPWDHWHWGYIHGELSALRWVLGEDWGFLDT